MSDTFEPSPQLFSQEELNNFIPELESEELITLDTEFERRKTFYPIPALLQIATSKRVALLDPTTCTEFDALFTALSPKTIIMHACREDMEVLRLLSNKELSAIHDTQIAAALVGLEPQVSYQKLVENLLGKQLPKDETCSNWLQRPLSETQIQYAVDDVHYLFDVYSLLMEKLNQLNRSDWYNQEMEILEEIRHEPEPESYFSKVKGAGRLNINQLSCLYDLVIWREKKVRKKDIPRGFLIKDRGLIEICKHINLAKPDLIRNLAGNQEVPPGFIKRYQSELNEIIVNPAESQQKALSLSISKKELPIESKKLAHEIKQFRNETAKQLEIKEEVLLSNKLIKQTLLYLYFDFDKSADFEKEIEKIIKPWRYQLLKPCLDKLAN